MHGFYCVVYHTRNNAYVVIHRAISFYYVAILWAENQTLITVHTCNVSYCLHSMLRLTHYITIIAVYSHLIYIYTCVVAKEFLILLVDKMDLF